MQRITVFILSFLFAAAVVPAPAWCSDAGRPLTVRFPAFALSPGERIMGVKLAASSGRIVTGCLPNRWTCDGGGGGEVHCYSLHPQYAQGLSGMLPQFIIRNSDSGSPSLQASVEFIDNNGKEYSREIREGDLIVK